MIKKNYKVKTFLKIISILFIITLLISHLVHSFLGEINGASMYRVEDFWKYKKDFTTVADMCLERFSPELNNNSDISCVFVSASVNNMIEFHYAYSSGDFSSYFYEEVDEDVVASFKSIQSAFPRSGERPYNILDNLMVYEDQVYFTTDGPYMLAYSKFKRPKRKYVDRRPFTFNWYDVINY